MLINTAFLRRDLDCLIAWLAASHKNGPLIGVTERAKLPSRLGFGSEPFQIAMVDSDR